MRLLNETEMQELESLSTEALVPRVLQLGGRSCLTNSFQLEDMVVLHLLRQYEPQIPVLFLDTGYHFAATYAYRDRIAREWKLNLLSLASDTPVARQEADFGMLNRTDPARCCSLRKVEPLMRGLAAYDIWFTGLRREQSPTRAHLRRLEYQTMPDGSMLLKVNPLAAWTTKQVWSYTAQCGIEYLPLYDDGYSSIGCEPCTSLPPDPDNPRSGRWSGKKLECGIHTFNGSGSAQEGR